MNVLNKVLDVCHNVYVIIETKIVEKRIKYIAPRITNIVNNASKMHGLQISAATGIVNVIITDIKNNPAPYVPIIKTINRKARIISQTILSGISDIKPLIVNEHFKQVWEQIKEIVELENENEINIASEMSEALKSIKEQIKEIKKEM